MNANIRMAFCHIPCPTGFRDQTHTTRPRFWLRNDSRLWQMHANACFQFGLPDGEARRHSFWFVPRGLIGSRRTACRAGKDDRANGSLIKNGVRDFKGSPTQGLRPCPRTVFGENPSLSLCQSAFAPHIPKYDPPPMISGDHAALCVRWGVIMATVGEEGGAIARCHFHMMPNTQFNLPFKVCLSGV